MEAPMQGLSAQEVIDRKERGDLGKQPGSITKTKAQIFKENIFTLFNLLNFIIAALLFAVGAYSNMIFIVIIIINVVIGIAQELKAKKLIDELSILNRPKAKLVRDGREIVVETEDIVIDDVMVLESGHQICNDGIVLGGMAEVNESLLTGESDAILKTEGSELYSGSFVVTGKCYAKTTHVGSENYAVKLMEETKKTKRVSSELLGSMKQVTRFTSFLIVPLGILLFLEAIMLRQVLVSDAVISSSAALLGMLPKGLVLLIAVSLANGVIRLANMKILVQNIYSLETLAHVDVLCLDKTGTITDGKMKVKEVLQLRDFRNKKLSPLIQSYLAASDDNNATFQALQEHFGTNTVYQQTYKIPFSSLRKWGAVSFNTAGTVFIGAAERIMNVLPAAVEHQIEKGCRAVIIGIYDGEWQNERELPDEIEPLCAVILEDNIRKGTAKTLEYFRKEGVDVKVISGDHIKTVSIIAKKAGLKDWENAVDLSSFGEDMDYDSICIKYTVFARVTPKQKQLLVMAMKRAGHQVAMTGDGVNDLLALREADCSIAIAEGSDASRQISQIVLLDSDFANLPQVVLEGRKVINNVTRTAGVFFIKTIYSLLLSIFFLLFNMPFPFIPIQITLIDAFIEAYPSFLTIFESNTKRVRSSFLRTALANAAPFALTITAGIIFISLTLPFDTQQRQTIMYMLLILVSMLSVIKSCIPFTKLRVFICVTMVLGAFGALWILPQLFEISAITTAMLSYIGKVFVGLLLILILLICITPKIEKHENLG
ncbi:HAD-IC family P-type ATPase [Lacrimispora sp.]|uniref:HAD-IC family P-type ATPase n=1 Tax=Lacrimispora sp. TaxID=2719234 RepID=UPI002864F183|nr:HAD-IC family P-type ATPase [Lacrimispora sp.]MDR7813881.1 HAD-IC family P-type ATPase [Lacrimispora sp.]